MKSLASEKLTYKEIRGNADAFPLAINSDTRFFLQPDKAYM